MSFSSDLSSFDSSESLLLFWDLFLLSPSKNFFAIDGVDGVFFGSDFITITKTEKHDWQTLKPLVFGKIIDHIEKNNGGDAVVGIYLSVISEIKKSYNQQQVELNKIKSKYSKIYCYKFKKKFW